MGDEGNQAQASAPKRPRLECQYGAKCYRRNADHLLEMDHPLLEKIYDQMKKTGSFEEIPEEFGRIERRTVLDQIKILREAREGGDKTNAGTSETSASSSMNQRQKSSTSEPRQACSMHEKFKASQPYNFFLSKVNEISVEKEGTFSAGFSDLFDPSLGEVKASVHFNFMIDPEWFLDQVMTAGIEGKPTRIIFDGKSSELQGMVDAFPWIKAFGVKSPFPFGHHHTKMSVVQYTDLSVRFFIYTANLIESDWASRTQGIWISPRCPKISSDSDETTPTSGDSVTKFRSDIIQYLNTYPVQATRAWIDVIKCVDCSDIKVYFVASAPVTAQSGSSGFQWGICKMEKILKSHDLHTDPSWPLVCQCSSIGTLGGGISDWVESELGKAFAGRDHIQKGPISLVYPSHVNVRDSFEGLRGGGCLPYSAKVHLKQRWLESHLCQWKCDRTGRTRAVPHIKSYFRMSPDGSKLAWFLLTSANLSKAAWGKLNKNKDRLSVMSWEAGVLFLPEVLISQDHLPLHSPPTSTCANHKFPLFLDIPLTKYDKGKGDRPWVFDTLQALISASSHQSVSDSD